VHMHCHCHRQAGSGGLQCPARKLSEHLHTPHTPPPHWYLDGCVRVPVIDPSPHGPQHQAEATWEAACVVLPQAELNRVDGGFNGARTEA
jgi:hypothetical protein